mgnify:CR=1 FL=1
MTWFTKGLRQLKRSLEFWYVSKTELTWFTKGLRRVQRRTICERTGWQNWPDLRRDCDDGFLNRFPLLKLSDRIDLIYEGIATWKWRASMISSSVRQNWPDLRRDCDNFFGSVHFCFSFRLTELTWFTKGLRLLLRILIMFTNSLPDRIDLIYEGIATIESWLECWIWSSNDRIDLIYEGIATFPSCCADPQKPLLHDRIDLIYEGIATNVSAVLIHPGDDWQNWPDLRRDCDQRIRCAHSSRRWLTELTWFTKGLRHMLTPIETVPAGIPQTELTWFTKGLRLNFSFDDLISRRQRQNWPDLRRDCDYIELTIELDIS